YLTQRTWPRAFAVVGAGMVVAVLTNGLRVAIAGMLGQKYGPDAVHGPAHIFQGWIVAQVGIVGVFLINSAVRRLPTKQTLKLHERWKLSRPNHSELRVRQFSWLRISAMLAALLGLAIYLQFFSYTAAVPSRQSLASLPLAIAEWKGDSSDWMKSSELYPGADSSLARVYRRSSSEEIYLYVGYFSKQYQ